MKKNVQKEEEVQEEVAVAETASVSELVKLVDLWEQLRALGVNSISDLEVKIARLK